MTEYDEDNLPEGFDTDTEVSNVENNVVKILNWLGYDWPITNTEMLDAWADQWETFQTELEAKLDDLRGGISYLSDNNSGEVVEAVAAYMNGDESQLHSLITIAQAAPIAGGAYRAASVLIKALRVYVSGQILLDVINLALAIFTGGASAAVSFLDKKASVRRSTLPSSRPSIHCSVETTLKNSETSHGQEIFK